MKKKGRFSKEEDQFILANYLTMPMKRISRALGRPPASARQRLIALGYKVPKEVAAQFRKQTQFQHGHEAHNKGKKLEEYMSPEGLERSKRTRFKKGNVPANTIPQNGTITIRTNSDGSTQQVIRLGKAKWQMLHVYNWEKKNGKVPKGFILSFKDSDTMNADPSNLELITRAENLKRNAGEDYLGDGRVAACLARYGKKVDHELKKEYLKHPELIELKRNELLLNRKIKKENDNRK